MPAYSSLQIIAANREPNHALNPAHAARRARQHVAKRKRHSKTNEAPRAVICIAVAAGNRSGDVMITRRRMLAACGGLAAMAAAKPAAAETAIQPVPTTPRNGAMEIKRIGSQPSGKGPADYFTGAVRVDPLFEAPDPARVRGASVTFEPGARTAWHTHPLGQTLIVTSGLGLARRWGGPVEEIRPGDVIWFPPGEKHWHGASPTTAMTHVAIQEALNGKVVDWLEPSERRAISALMFE
jgi:quercetin dioxygenase-like cupin family protein